MVAFGGFPSLAEQGKTNVKVWTVYVDETENRKKKTSHRLEAALQIHFHAFF